MKIICYLVSEWLSLRESQDKTPKLAARHIENCPRCKTETANRSRIAEGLKTAAAEIEPCRLNWKDVKDRITSSPQQIPPRSKVVYLVPAAAAACMIALIATGIIDLAPDKLLVKTQKVVAVQTLAEVPKPVVHQPRIETKVVDDPPAQAPTSVEVVKQTTEQRSPVETATERQIATQIRQTAVSPNMIESEHTNPVAQQAQSLETNSEMAPAVTAATPLEEHVIDIVRVQEEDDYDSYPIRQVNAAQLVSFKM